MSRLSELIEELCPEGVEYKKVGDCLTYEQPNKYIVHSSEYENKGVPVLTAGQTFILGYTSETDGIYNSSKENPVIIFDDFTTSFHWVDFKFKVKSSAMKMLYPISSDVSFRYIYYAMKCIKYETLEHSRQWISKYSSIEIPVPPLPVQEEIVRILDTFTALITELEAELEARKQQYEYYRNKLLTFDDSVERKKLGDVCDFVRGPFGGSLKKSSFTKEGYAVYEQQHAIYGGLNFRYYIDESKFKAMKRFAVHPGDLIMSCSGTMGKIAIIPEQAPEGIINQALLKLTPKEGIICKYLKYCFENSITKSMNQKAQGGAIKNVASVDVLKSIEVPVPPLAEQQRIVSILDKFETLITDHTYGIPAEIEARRKQYEYYRDKLLTFKRKETVKA